MSDELLSPIGAGIHPARSQSNFFNMPIIDKLQRIFLLTKLRSHDILLNASNRGDLYQDLRKLNRKRDTASRKLKPLNL